MKTLALASAVAALLGFGTAAAAPRGVAANVASLARAAEGPWRAELLWRVPWGDRPGQLGHRLGSEANAEGPMSFDVDAEGRVWVLDQANFRVQAFEAGRPVATVAIPSDVFQDVAVARDGLVLLDRLVSASVWYFDFAGTPRQQVSVEGAGIPIPGGITGLYPHPDGLWLSFADQYQVRVATPDGAPDRERPIRSGQLSRDGRNLIGARIADPLHVEVAFAPADGSGKVTRRSIAFRIPVFRIDGFASDDDGNLYVAADLLHERAAPPHEILEEVLQVVILAPDGRELQRLDLPPNDAPEEQFRLVRMGADGALYQLRATDRGAELRRIAR